jgi:hypothetical protein
MVGDRRRLGRRQARTRALVRLGVPLVLSTVVVLLAAGAVAHIGPSSGPYRRAVNGGFAALTLPLVQSSDASGASLASFFGHATRVDRATFFDTLDTLAADTASTQRRFEAVTPPDPAASVAGCGDAMAARAHAVALVRTAFEGVVGGENGLGTMGLDTASPDVASASTLLLSADSSWSQCRRLLKAAPGHARLPASVWIRDRRSVNAAALSGLLGAVAATPSLAPVHRLAIVAVVTDPQSVPSQQTRVAPPTTSLVAHVVIANQGNVNEDGVEVGGTVHVQDQGASPVPVQSTVTVAAGASASLTLPRFTVVPGATYVLQVTAESPRAQSAGVIVSRDLTVQVQPATTLIAVSATTPAVRAGQLVALEAAITPGLSGIGAPSGTVAFTDDGATISACAAQPVRADRATCNTALAPGATHAVGATYSGDSRFSSSISPAISVTVAQR